MARSLFLGTLFALAAPVLATAACPAGVTPGTFLLGQTWAFRLTGAVPELGVVGAIGKFTAVAPGYLSIVETTANVLPNLAQIGGNSINRLAPAFGRWLVNADCTGGQLQFMLNREFYTVDFTVDPSGTQMTLGGVADNSGFTSDLVGTARLNPPRSCPAGLGNPLNLLKNTKYAYTANGSFYTETGTFTATFPNPAAYSGDLKIDRTITDLFFDFVGSGFNANFPTYGRYTIYPDCSGGELLLNVNRFSIQLEFVFSRADFSEMYLLGDSLLYAILPNVTLPLPFVVAPYTGIALRQ